VYIYNGYDDSDFDSPRLRAVLRLVRRLEEFFHGCHLDIEFALDKAGTVHLLQVRRLCTTYNWDPNVASSVSSRIKYVEKFIKSNMNGRPGLFGKQTIFTVMSDWNPAEMIGVTPRPLAFSLYRALITKDVWRRAREKMGYLSLPSVELMVSIVGHPYIDVRASFNSFLPDGVGESLGNALVDAWINYLSNYPELHDKVEFGIVQTVLDFDFDEVMRERYHGVLSKDEISSYKEKLREITSNALKTPSTLHYSLDAIKKLSHIDNKKLPPPPYDNNKYDPFSIISTVARLLVECQEFGTLPFSIAARHGFIAEALLRSAVRKGAIDDDRIGNFKLSIRTVASELTDDFGRVIKGELPCAGFLSKYGHLRPGTYDILVPCYADREDIFDQQVILPSVKTVAAFQLTSIESSGLQKLLDSAKLNVSPEELLSYASASISAREYIKFVFTRHVSAILELLALWGREIGLARDMVAMLPLEDILEMLHSPLSTKPGKYFSRRVAEYQKLYDLTRSFRLSHIIRSPRDVYVVPQHRSAPNFITNKRVDAPICYMNATEKYAYNKLSGAIVCIEGADPGYDWIFSRNIAGLITQYGGSNSHMAIRCAEYGLPAAIGCGELLFKRVIASPRCLLDCACNTIMPSRGNTL
jgi:hypothetical protein